MIDALFPEGVVVVEGTLELSREPLHPEEEALTARMSEARRSEFALGRACARRALATLGVAAPVLRGDDRAPIWPEGVVGTLSHCDDFCAAAVARAPGVAALGLDIERDTALSARVAERISTPDERRRLLALPAPDNAQWEKLVFSAKESFYKAYFSLTRTYLGFQEVEIDFDPAARTFQARLLTEGKPGPRAARGRFALAPPHVMTAVTLRPEEVAGSATECASGP